MCFTMKNCSLNFEATQLQASAKNGEDTRDVLQWNTISSIFLKLWMVEFSGRKGDELALTLTFFNNPTIVRCLVLKELI